MLPQVVRRAVEPSPEAGTNLPLGEMLQEAIASVEHPSASQMKILEPSRCQLWWVEKFLVVIIESYIRNGCQRRNVFPNYREA
jgi:hypothetical protein